MYFHRVVSPGLKHLSYILGDGPQLAVFDPRRDVDQYIDLAQRHEARISYIFETHRHQDLVSGAFELAERTGARVIHGAALDFAYGEPVRDGEAFRLGDLILIALETPGHSDESISVAVFESDSIDHAWGVFTGDTLLFGEVGCVDHEPELRPGRALEVSDQLYRSIFEKILPLGDQALLFPAHGPGSTHCRGIAERPFSTLGYERLTNPMLGLERGAFMRAKLTEPVLRPPYFGRIEVLNTQGPDRLAPRVPFPRSPAEVHEQSGFGETLVDLRAPEAFWGGHLPGSLSLPAELVSDFGGWLLSYGSPLILISEVQGQIDQAIRDLSRIGFDRIGGYLRGGLRAWESSGRSVDHLVPISTEKLRDRLENRWAPDVIDVRTKEEFAAGHILGARNIFLGELSKMIDQLRRDQSLVTFCTNGERATIAASVLRKSGFSNVEVCPGSLPAWEAIQGPVERHFSFVR